MARRTGGGDGRQVAGLAAVLVAAAVLPAAAQVHEDRLDPADLGIVGLERLREPPAAYVGNLVCAECHAEAYRTWLGTRHARTYVWLESRRAMRIAEAAGVEAESPRRAAFCLGCHATAADVAAEWREPGFRMGEGVACEKCHGPGGAHAEAMAAGEPDPFPLRRPTEQDCLVCHAAKPSHAEVPTNGTFEFAPRWKEIAHPEDRNE
jgi:hypothetical protein